MRRTLHQRLRVMALAQGTSINAIVEGALERELGRREKLRGMTDRLTEAEAALRLRSISRPARALAR